MPISPIAPSQTEGAFEVVHQALSWRALGGAFSLPGLSKVDPGSLSLAMPHRVECLALDDLRRGTMPKKEGGACWRFLVLRRDDVIAAATAFRGEKNAYVFGDVGEGRFVRGTADAIRQAEALAEVREGQFEAVLLLVPARYVVALWLQDRSCRDTNGHASESDLLIPIPPSNPALDPGTPLSPAAFVKALQQAR